MKVIAIYQPGSCDIQIINSQDGELYNCLEGVNLCVYHTC